MTVEVAAPSASATEDAAAAAASSVAASRSNSEMSGSSESLNRDNSISEDENSVANVANGNHSNGVSVANSSGGDNVLSEIGNKQLPCPPAAASAAAMGAKKKMSAPPKMIEDQTREIRRQQLQQLHYQQSTRGRLKLRIDSIQEEDSPPATEPPSATPSECDSEVEMLRSKTDILPWNIVTDPPQTNRNELYPIEGSWRLISNQNYDKYLAAIGVTPLMAQMVLRSDFMITIYEDIDKCWKILTETSIKAKSIKGYKCRNYKMTSNKFMLEEAKPELLDDWDPRLVVTTLTFDEETKSLLVFDQVAEKDMKFHMSTRIALEAESSEDGDPSKDILVMTCETSKGVRAIRRLIRHLKPTQDPATYKVQSSRKISAPF